MASAVSVSPTLAGPGGIDAPAHGRGEISWLIVGGGIHGLHIAVRLIGEAGCNRDEVRILDPAGQLLARWRACTSATGMTHLRSPSVHQIDLESLSLQRFAAKLEHRTSELFASPYERPSLDLFNEHCDRVIEAHGVEALHVRGAASSFRVDCEGVAVDTLDGQSLPLADLARTLGSRPRASEVLSRKRRMTLPMIRKIHEE